jgi:hypothetical protein
MMKCVVIITFDDIECKALSIGNHVMSFENKIVSLYVLYLKP